MKNKGLIITSLLIIGMLFMTSCQKHNWAPATCDEPEKCLDCGKTKGSPLGHDWHEATMIEPKTCARCGLTEGSSLIETYIQDALPTTTNQKVDLPTNIEGYEVSWKSLDTEIMLDDGIIIANDTPKTAIMEATYTDGEKSNSSTFTIEVEPVSVSVRKYEIAYDYYQLFLKNGISGDINFVTTEYNGCSVRYLSQDETILTSDGKIHQTKDDQKVILNIYVIDRGIAVLFPTEVTVNSYPGLLRLDLATTYLTEYLQKYEAGETDVIPKYIDDYDVDITWTANVPEFMVLEDVILTPIKKTAVKLSALLSYGSVATTVEYMVNVGGTMTEEEYLDIFIKEMTKINLKGSINHLHPEYNDELFLDYQERINSYGVLNLAQGTNPLINRDYLIDVNDPTIKNRLFGRSGSAFKPSVGQSFLDTKFYQGYQMPNDDNVLWITVHESAMTVDAQTAEFLAALQHRSAYETNDPRAASWNYQVDAYSIYQSFGDDVVCWHAGDGTSIGTGNSNGIGIEMCVNQDGNYEGTLMNNAKLVAYFMLKYNLNFDNVKRHADFAKKECPSYLIRTKRWEEFLSMVRKEYIIQKYFSDVNIEYNLTTSDCKTTEEVLNHYFITGANGLYYNKPVDSPVEVNFEIVVNKNNHEYKANSTFMLLPDTK